MKKIIFILLVILPILMITSCKDKDNLNLEQLYVENMTTAYELYQRDLAMEECIYQTSDEFIEMHGFQTYKMICLPFGSVIDSIIYVKYNQRISIVLAAEYDSEKTVKDKIDEGLIDLDTYYVYKNCAFLDIFASTVLIEGEYIKENNIGLSIDTTKLLYGSNESTFTIPDTVTSISSYACYNNKKITSITMPTNLEKINKYAFKGCEFLIDIKLNQNLKYIETHAFEDAYSLRYIVIPKSVEYIGTYAFNTGNIFLETETIPSTFDTKFAVGKSKVFVSGEWKYNTQGIPVPINNN